MGDTKYNPADKGKSFNEDAPIDFQDITDEDKQTAHEKLGKLMEDTFLKHLYGE